MANQIELDLKRAGRTKLQSDAPVRKRTVLLEDLTFDQAMGTEDRVPVSSEAQVSGPELLGGDGPLSAWTSCLIPPPCSGDWDVRAVDESCFVRCTFNAKTNGWLVPGWPFPVIFGAGRLWRGLAYDPKVKK